jgi:hypothetical protein
MEQEVGAPVVAEAAGSAIVEGRCSYGLQELVSELRANYWEEKERKQSGGLAVEVEEELAARIAGLGPQLVL